MNARLRLWAAVGMLLSVHATYGSPASPCQILPAEAWSSVMGYKAGATPGDMNCSYTSKAGGGQFRILLNASSNAEAEAAAKRFRGHTQRGKHNAALNLVDFQGRVVFSIALFQPVPDAKTASQLQRLAIEAKKHIAK